MEDLLATSATWVAAVAEGLAVLVIAFALLEALLGIARLAIGRERDPLEAKQDVRLRLARWLGVALELLLAADIVETAVAPTWDEIGKLAAIATLRTLLNYFLEREIDRDEARDRERRQPSLESAAR